jgi:hypothetical protein
MGGEGSPDFGERDLHVGKRVHARESGAKDVGAADHAGGILGAFVIALVEVTELLAAKCGRAAKDAILLEMVASRVRHKTSKSDRADRDERAAKDSKLNGARPQFEFRVTPGRGQCK